MVKNFKKIALFLIVLILLVGAAINSNNNKKELEAGLVAETVDFKTYIQNNYVTGVSDNNYFSKADFFYCKKNSSYSFEKIACTGRVGDTHFLLGTINQTDDREKIQESLVAFLTKNFIFAPGKTYLAKCEKVVGFELEGANLIECHVSNTELTVDTLEPVYSMSVLYFNNDKEISNFLVTSPKIDSSNFKTVLTGTEVSSLETFRFVKVAHAGGGESTPSESESTPPSGFTTQMNELEGTLSIAANNMSLTGPNTYCCNEMGNSISLSFSSEPSSGSSYTPASTPSGPSCIAPYVLTSVPYLTCTYMAGGGGNRFTYNDVVNTTTCPASGSQGGQLRGSAPGSQIICIVPAAPVPAPTVTTTPAPVPVPPPVTSVINGICGATHYSCLLGTSANNLESALIWSWDCFGSGGGTDALSCNENKAAPACPTAWGGQSCSTYYGVPTMQGNVTYTYDTCTNAVTGNIDASACIIPSAAPTVSLSAAPATVMTGGSATLTWLVTGATSCTASDGWSGAKASSGTNNEMVTNITNTTSYTLSCTGPGGVTTDTTTVALTSGFIAADPCTITAGNTSCPTNVVWESFNFIGTPQVWQGTNNFSSAPSTLGTVRSISPTDSTFTLNDDGGAFTTSFTAIASCDPLTSLWVPALGVCAPLPTITITADPNVIRSGTSATLDVEIDALYDLTCTFRDGGAPATFTHSGAPAVQPQQYTRTTRNLTSAQIVSISCVAVVDPLITGAGEARVNVVPTIQEI
jgi:hypothetical protein